VRALCDAYMMAHRSASSALMTQYFTGAATKHAQPLDTHMSMDFRCSTCRNMHQASSICSPATNGH
jgi:hypothetical protein